MDPERSLSPQERDHLANLLKTAEDPVALGWTLLTDVSLPNNIWQAIYCFQRAAKKGCPDGQCSLGRMFEEGRGFEQDGADAADWYRKAAEQGHAEAQHRLGALYAYNQEVPKDYEEALRWFHLAAEQGYAWGECDIGIMHEFGHGVSQDLDKAVAWFEKAALRGNGVARSKLSLHRKSRVE
ncbi:MAG: sel1 repeat family protein [Magnetococcales bacterium]|nr:sel1 repeat family protein [Magnetococcales bacterium]